MIYNTLLIESLNKPRMAVCGVNAGNVKSQWKCLFNYSHKYLVELQDLKTNVLVFCCIYYNSNIVETICYCKEI